MTRDVYYIIKPILPRSLQLFLRRVRALWILRHHQSVWPILKSSGKSPVNWSGWPEGKMFSLVLTHDVESAKGLGKCERLMEIEKRYGFRSSFNFVPEGYPVPEEFRKKVEKQGFEVGIHGLTHKGNLFRSRNTFLAKAKRINEYMENWGCVGFRAPSMFHNLEWTHELNVEYDLSTFDTDPFEPQPDGVGTIFPFFVHDSHPVKGYVELPYTLPQDSTLFLLLRNQNIGTWIKKLDWVADKGGMVLVNVHPDYINFDGKPETVDEYPVKFYTDFLEYLSSKYAGQYWHVLPREMARFWRNSLSS